jgi:hypothetical protein
MNPAMIVRLAVLEITTDELLQPKAAQNPLRRRPCPCVLRRSERIELESSNRTSETCDLSVAISAGSRASSWICDVDRTVARICIQIGSATVEPQPIFAKEPTSVWVVVSDALVITRNRSDHRWLWFSFFLR